MLFADIEKHMRIRTLTATNKDNKLKTASKLFEMWNTVRNLTANGIMGLNPTRL